MIKVGITGGIGSGKSTVCKVFRVLGIPVFEADVAAKIIMNTDEAVREKLIQLFGSAVYLPDRSLDRKHLAGIVFNNPTLLGALNQIVHPEVHLSFEAWYKNQDAGYVLYEAAILFESGFYKNLDRTITVVTDENERIGRVIARDNIPAELVKQRMNNQWSDEEKIKLADFVIGNNENELIIPQIIEIDKKLKADVKSWQMD